MIQGVNDMRDAYRDERVATEYISERFVEPLGALLHRRQADVLRQVIASARPERVLEIAPGPARLTVEVAPLLERAPVVIDASAQMLVEARRRLAAIDQRATVIHGDAFQLPLTATFDLVYTFRLIRHFAREERSLLYAQIGRGPRPNALLVFDAVNEIVSARARARAKPCEHYHYDALLRPDALEHELGEAGFKIVSLIGVQHRYESLHQIQVLVAPRSRWIARGAMELLDRSGGEPLEWVVVCRRE